MPSPLAKFLSGTGPDGSGRFHADVLGMTDQELEHHHDYIQWLFPLPEPSRAVPGSPVLTQADIASIRQDPAVRDNLMEAGGRMQRFYEENDHWLIAFDHNHLRISRIIRSLHILVGRKEAEEFLRAVLARNTSAGNPVNNRSLSYWRAASEKTQ